MKYYFLLATILFVQISFSQDIPSELKKYNKGIDVTHSKDTIYAELYKGNKANRKKYLWRYKTSVKAENKELKIIEFGGYNKIDSIWVSTTIYDRPFNNSEFAKWYGCENGILTIGKVFTDKNNWTTSDYLDGQTKTGIWYYIGIDSKGEKFIGFKEYVLVGKLNE
ncbi:hypothetical protein [Mangrovimonas xylaniphaga]|uniref:hypothetical protein n=1 Tax=Mangrovimonas xylaniphaga TaxID=1645915 RepID=UPI0006B4127B|nr:hypothetical protein [Mangrovimonas xylaniphaga]